LITRNEAVHLGDCLASLRGHVDEVVIVDTGSQDDTVAIAEARGCRVLHEAWADDFSSPRNTGLEAARGDWILYIDADERLRCTQDTPLMHRIPDTGAAAARVRLQPMAKTTAYAEMRLFRRDPRIRFEGVMHERMVPGVERVCREDGVGIAERFDVEIVHLGYEGDQAHKHARNLPLLERAIPLDPKRVYLRYHLGTTLHALGRAAQARAALEAGVALAGASMRDQERVEGSLCCQALAAIALEESDATGSIEAAETGLGFYEDQLALRWARARALVPLHREREAIAILRDLVGHDPERFFDPRIAYEKSLFREDSLGLMGAAHFALGEYHEAERLFSQAAAVAADPLEYRTKAALSRSRQ
jgi:hypothetical protein